MDSPAVSAVSIISLARRRRLQQARCWARRRLSRVSALRVLRVLRKEWEMATSDLKHDSGVEDRAAFTRALDELQAGMLVIPEGVYYEPKFTYIWTLAI